MNQLFDKYFDKSGDEQIFISNLIENEHGFASYALDENAVIVQNVYGDGEYWNKFFHELAINNGLKKIRFSTRRNPETLKRKYKCKIVAHIMEKEVGDGQ